MGQYDDAHPLERAGGIEVAGQDLALGGPVRNPFVEQYCQMHRDRPRARRTSIG